MYALPTPVSITFSMSERGISFSYKYLPKAPNSDVTGSVALTNMGFRISLSSIPTILVVLPPTSIPITMPIIFLLISDSKIRVLIEN